MVRQMYDAASVGNIPADAAIVGYYIDGNYKASTADLSRFKNAVHVPIAVFPTTNAGIVFDGPPDNSTWPQVVDWVVMRRKAGVDPSVYTDNDQWTTGVAEFRARGVAQPHWWIAKWDGVQTVMSGAVAHQYQGNQHGGYDRSVVLDYWPGVDPAPKPTPAPAPPAVTPAPPPAPKVEDDDMILIQVNATTGFGGGIWLLSGSMLANVATSADALALEAQGVKLAVISKATYDKLVAASAQLTGSLSGSLAVQGNLQVT